ncbi:hypothetical protein MJH12_19495, partial [bacterium]|nr:hypothetical protein [bacterium]
FHLGFCAFFISASWIGIELTYTPQSYQVECQSEQFQRDFCLQENSLGLILASVSNSLTFSLKKIFRSPKNLFFGILVQLTFDQFKVFLPKTGEFCDSARAPPRFLFFQ